ncbi:FecCD family ABC transporter permease [Pseudogracilibacillus auburnensis]|uniref:Iron complex transport system permease protein n=1 Tax=Pseudogracilibacillus auburnensis TaxID=1494959 RepID=A0A2V3VY67_9BACI|nr:iron ABC transporter permease [Pseudogracilibacillus auburnensis]MBO1004052.1 iron ABC transporter permease [Pseudogracilibacillus auburnensis]PXW85658.1 iron complex transport system permease protein [Pseudogracilibacillus auburnensis]
MTIQKRNLRRKYISIITPILFIVVTFYSLTYGPVSISLAEIWHVFFQDGESIHQKIIIDVRLPRVIIGILVGGCLAASGALLQGVMKNPLADPGIIGVSSGAGLAAIITMVLLPQYSFLLPIAAFIGALITSLAIYVLAWDRGTSPVKIILAGVAINALLGAVMNGIMVVYSERVQAVLPWLAGGLTGRGWFHLEFMAPYAIISIILSFFAIKPANLLLLGDDSAKLLGQKVEVQRFLLIILASLLAGVAVSVAGLVGFVGLVVPHIIRILVGDDYTFLLPFSIVSGAILVVFADTVARSWFDPIELPVGILLACLGAPFFLILLRKRRIL